jgi:hypothetical protein
MANYVVNANSSGAFYLNVGNTGVDDNVTVAITNGFSGTINVDSIWGEGEAELVDVDLPSGWTAVLSLEQELIAVGGEPAYFQRSYDILDASRVTVGTLLIRDNAPDDITSVPCFVAGTLIATPTGNIAAQDLRANDLVTTLEHGAQKVRWITCSNLGDGISPLPSNATPVRIKPGLFGNRLPLIVSPQHCILMVDEKTGKRFYTRAKHLAEETPLASFARGPKRVTYVHVLLDHHATLSSNDIPSESFYPGMLAQESLPATSRKELHSVLPGLIRKSVEEVYGPRVSQVIDRKELRRMAEDGTLTPLSFEKMTEKNSLLAA